MNPLEQYIYDQLTKGYTPDQIRSFLVSKGYEQKQVENAIVEARESLAEKQIINYISSTLQQGYAPKQIHDQLVHQGYHEKTVDLAFDDVNKNQYGGKLTVEHEHSVSNSSIIKIGAMLLLVIVIVGGGFFGISHLLGQDDVKLLDLSSEAVAMTLQKGDSLKFRLTMLNQGDPGRVDIYLTYTIETQEGNRVIKKQETKAFETTIRDVVSMDLPPDIRSGTYKAKVEANYKDQYALSSFTFYVVEDGEQSLNNNQETNVESNTNTNSNSQETANTQVITRQPPEIKTVNVQEETNDEIFTKAITETNTETAAGYCQQISDKILKDECFVYTASASKNVNYCDLVVDVSRQEDCKMNFILEGQTELCNELTLEENKKLCSQYSQINAMYDYGQSGNLEALMGELHIEPLPAQTPTEVKPHESIQDLDIADVTFPVEQ